MNYEPRDIRQIKLVTGDEILTEIIGEDSIEFLIRNPLKVFKEKFLVKGVPKEANFFTRWMAFAENNEFIINKTHIVVEAIVDDSVADYYNNMMHNLEKNDTIHIGEQEEDEPEQYDLLDMLDGTDKPTFH